MHQRRRMPSALRACLEQGQVAAVLGRFHHVGVGLQAGVRLGCHVADFVGQLQGAGLGGLPCLHPDDGQAIDRVDNVPGFGPLADGVVVINAVGVAVYLVRLLFVVLFVAADGVEAAFLPGTGDRRGGRGRAAWDCLA